MHLKQLLDFNVWDDPHPETCDEMRKRTIPGNDKIRIALLHT